MSLMYLGTLIYTFFKGRKAGIDEFGNRYYHAPKDKLHGRERRWVLYGDNKEASSIPPEWHAWLHHTTRYPLIEKAVQAKHWQLPQKANPTGSSEAYYPKGHDLTTGSPPSWTEEYQAWQPDT